MINKGAFSIQEDTNMSAFPIALTTSSPSSPANESRNASSTFNPRTAPNCARCKNHGLKNGLKGHKRYCRFWNCRCEKCLQTENRQKVMARETAHRRARKLHESKILEYEEAKARAERMGEKLPEMPPELLEPLLQPSPPGDIRAGSKPGSTIRSIEDSDLDAVSPTPSDNDSGMYNTSKLSTSNGSLPTVKAEACRKERCCTEYTSQHPLELSLSRRVTRLDKPETLFKADWIALETTSSKVSFVTVRV